MREALTAFGMQLDDALLDRFSRQAFTRGAAEASRGSPASHGGGQNVKRGGDAGEGEEGKGVTKGKREERRRGRQW